MDTKTADIKKLWGKVQTYLELKRKKEAIDELNKGIGLLGSLTLTGVKEVSGLPIDKWKKRFWLALEENGGLSDDGYDPNNYDEGLMNFQLGAYGV